WAAAIALLTTIARFVARRTTDRVNAAFGIGAAAGLTGLLVVSAAWRINGASPLRRDSATLALLRRYDPDSGQLAVRYAPTGRIPLGSVPPLLTIADGDTAARSDEEGHLMLKDVAAGTYAIDAQASGGASGRVSIVLDREFGPAASWDIAGADG